MLSQGTNRAKRGSHTVCGDGPGLATTHRRTARHDRHDFYQKTDRLAAGSVPAGQGTKESPGCTGTSSLTVANEPLVGEHERIIGKLNERLAIVSTGRNGLFQVPVPPYQFGQTRVLNTHAPICPIAVSYPNRVRMPPRQPTRSGHYVLLRLLLCRQCPCY